MGTLSDIKSHQIPRVGVTAGFFIRTGLGRPKPSDAKVKVRGARLQAVVWAGTQSFCSKYVNHKGEKMWKGEKGKRIQTPR